MATKKFYAWSDITYRVDGERKVLRAGAVATKELLGLDDNRWGVLVKTRAVRTDEYPPIDRNSSNILSPVAFYREQARRAERLELDGLDNQLTAVLDPDDELAS